MMEFITFALVLSLALILFKIRRMLRLKQNKDTPSNKVVDLDWEVYSFLLSPLKIIYLMTSTLLFIISLYVVFLTTSVVFFKDNINGTVVGRTCVRDSIVKNKCLEGYYSYQVNYYVDKKKFTLSSGPKGVRIKSPSKLYQNDVQEGELVEIYVSKINPKNSVLKSEVMEPLIYTISLILVTSSLFFHSIILLKQKKAGTA